MNFLLYIYALRAYNLVPYSSMDSLLVIIIIRFLNTVVNGRAGASVDKELSHN